MQSFFIAASRGVENALIDNYSTWHEAVSLIPSVGSGGSDGGGD